MWCDLIWCVGFDNEMINKIFNLLKSTLINYEIKIKMQWHEIINTLHFIIYNGFFDCGRPPVKNGKFHSLIHFISFHPLWFDQSINQSNNNNT